MIHELKILPQHFRDWKAGIKRCEVRLNDRDFKVGDTLHLREFDPVSRYSGDGLLTDVLGMLTSEQCAGLVPEYVVLYCSEPKAWDVPWDGT